MSYTAELRFAFDNALLVTASTTGKGPPSYEFGDTADAEGVVTLLDQFYEFGPYGTGSIGQVQDMLHALRRYAEELGSPDWIKLVIPEATSKKAAEERAKDQKLIDSGVVM